MGKTASSGLTLSGESGPGKGRSAFGLCNPGQNVFPLSQAQAAHTASCRKAFLQTGFRPVSVFCTLSLVPCMAMVIGFGAGVQNRVGTNVELGF